MRARLGRAVSRANYAAVGAGAAVGGLFSRTAASTGGAAGGLVGGAVGGTRHSVSGVVERVRAERSE